MHRERVLRPVSGDDEKLDDDVGQPQGRRRHLVLVLGGEHLRHVPRLRGREDKLGADQRPGQIGAQHRDEEPDADEDGTPVSDHRLEHGRRHGRLPHPGDLGPLAALGDQEPVQRDQEERDQRQSAGSSGAFPQGHVRVRFGTDRLSARSL
jgi:hypothetical protein